MNEPAMAPMGSSGRAPQRPHRRGSAYVLFMATSMLITIIGLTAITISRLEVRAANDEDNAAMARVYADSALEVGLIRMYTDPDWRSTYTHDLWEPAEPIGRGSFQWKLADEANLSLSADDTAPVRLYGKGICGDSVWVYSVLVRPQDQTLVAGPDMITNGDMETGVSPWWQEGGGTLVAANSLATSHNETSYLWSRGRPAPDAGPRQTIPVALERGITYRAEMWIRFASAVDTVWISLEVSFTDGTTELFPLNGRRVSTTYTRLSGVFTPSWAKTVAGTTLRVTTATSTDELYMDDVSLTRIPSVSLGPIPGTRRREPQ